MQAVTRGNRVLSTELWVDEGEESPEKPGRGYL